MYNYSKNNASSGNNSQSTSGQNGTSKGRNSLAGSLAAASRNSLNPAKMARGASNASDITSFNVATEPKGTGRSSFGSGNRPSISSNRQSLLPNSGLGRPSLAPRSSVGLDGALGRFSGGSSFKSSSASLLQTSNMKDPRNVRDKNFILSSIRLVVEFLAKNEYDKPISQKILNSPSAKDFQYIFRFLYLQLDSAYEFEKKFEDEVLVLLKQVKYPFANDISKSHLMSVGSLHSWPVLLGMLVWMVELIVCYQNISVDFLENSPEASLFEFLLKGYQNFVDGNEDISAMKKKLIAKFEEANVPIIKEIDTLRTQNYELTSAIDALVNGETALPRLQKDKTEFVSDIERFKKFIKMIEGKRDKLMDIFKKEQEEAAKYSAEISVLEEEKRTLQAQVDAQEICPDDVERINSEKEQLLKTIDQLNQQKDEANKIFWEREITYQKRFDQMEKSLQEYNHFGEKIGVIPVESPYAKGIALELTLNQQSQKPDQLVAPNLKQHIQPSLSQLRDHLNDCTHASKATLLSLHEQLDALNDVINEKQEEFRDIEDKLRRYNQQYLEEREAMSAETKKRAEEIDALEKELAKIKAESTNSFISSQQFVQKATLDHDSTQTRIKEETEQVAGELCTMLDELLSFKTHVEASFVDLTALVEREAADASIVSTVACLQ